MTPLEETMYLLHQILKLYDGYGRLVKALTLSCARLFSSDSFRKITVEKGK
jgi:hypothetical protein